ncbi:hypothetical protein AYL99_08930 [Fonsecaea erecta]|uniref:Zn(2)-C6 fungal-type domain-containing protein n=1 Tax=Fonsecaea erecta TaxID=1367422 RepID=A0A178ZAM0_9EURO|nr:hypothetical protein AYL99_08930 [Fonsecaea erecta]OAP56818.1 hypothetical protein AYL99_08930 [Fonsecaea erecta]
MTSAAIAPLSPSRSRPYRSKRARPCDLCRSRKACCRINTAPPCGLCAKLGLNCTFEQQPSKRRSSHRVQLEGDDDSPGGQHDDASPQSAGLPSFPGRDLARARAQVQAARDQGRIDREGQARTGRASSFHFPTPLERKSSAQSQAHDAVWRDEAARLNETPLLPEMAELDFERCMPFDCWLAGDVFADLPALVEPVSLPDEGHAGEQPFTAAASQYVAASESHAIDGRRENVDVPKPASRASENPLDSQMSYNSRLAVNSLDDKKGTNAQFFGLSGESDPYLLQHYRYDERGEFTQFKLSYRKVADDSSSAKWLSSPPPNGVPVYFKVSPDDLEGDIKEETTIRPNVSSETIRKELYDLVSIEDGCRLMDLFLKYVFPSFPAISRSQLGITPTNPTVSPSTLETMPTHLLAAIYASSLVYCPHDDHLCVSKVYHQPSATKIWRIVYEEMFREIHTPHLSLVQAMLLYLQKPRTGQSSVACDTPFHWSLMSMLMALSTSLALHLDCQAWNIPAWEKRLRRRLWWMVYVEEKWRCLLGGYPSLIHGDQWDVAELTEKDFVIDRVDDDCHRANNGDRSNRGNSWVVESGERFCQLAQLSIISEEVYSSFYTLRAARQLSHDFDASLAKAQPIRLRLKAWYAALPASLQIRKSLMLDETGFAELESNSALHFAYLTLEVLLYRALLRPMNLRRGPRLGANVNLGATASGGHHRDGNDGDGDHSMTDDSPHSLPDVVGDNRAAAEAVIVAAEKCAKIVTHFTAGLDSQKFSAGFWYSWSRIGFATMSNLAMLLLVKAPDDTHLLAAKRILQNWRRMLRFQSRSFEQMKLGLLRLEVMLWKGMDDYILDERGRDARGT